MICTRFDGITYINPVEHRVFVILTKCLPIIIVRLTSSKVIFRACLMTTKSHHCSERYCSISRVDITQTCCSANNFVVMKHNNEKKNNAKIHCQLLAGQNLKTFSSISRYKFQYNSAPGNSARTIWHWTVQCKK